MFCPLTSWNLIRPPPPVFSLATVPIEESVCYDIQTVKCFPRIKIKAIGREWNEGSFRFIDFGDDFPRRDSDDHDSVIGTDIVSTGQIKWRYISWYVLGSIEPSEVLTIWTKNHTLAPFTGNTREWRNKIVTRWSTIQKNSRRSANCNKSDIVDMINTCRILGGDVPRQDLGKYKSLRPTSN